jgi:hypothetical protein
MFYGMCDDCVPDYCSSMVSCAGAVTIVGNIAVLEKAMELSKGVDKCFNPSGAATFTLTGNQSALNISEYAWPGGGTMNGMLTRCLSSY